MIYKNGERLYYFANVELFRAKSRMQTDFYIKISKEEKCHFILVPMSLSLILIRQYPLFIKKRSCLVDFLTAHAFCNLRSTLPTGHVIADLLIGSESLCQLLI